MGKTDKKHAFVRTGTPNLYRRDGRYLARTQSGGKPSWLNLETTDLQVAKRLLPAALEKMRNAARAGGGKTPTMEEALDAALAEIQSDPDLAESTKEKYYPGNLVTIKRTCQFLKLPVTRVTKRHYEEWYHAHRDQHAFSRTEGCLPIWNRVWRRCVEDGYLLKVPELNINRKKARSKDPHARKPTLEMPTPEQFSEILVSIRTHGRFGREWAADYVEFLACTGLRKSEGQEVQWRDIDWKEGTLRVRGRTKGCETLPPVISLTPQALEILVRIRKRGLVRRGEKRHHVAPVGADRQKPTDHVLVLRDVRHSLHAACARVGAPDMRIHDLRHLFITRCIQAKVDVPTIADWVGHKDGGKLILETYAHLCKQHSAQQAALVVF